TLRQQCQRIAELQPLLLLNKGEEVAALAAAKALPGTRLGEDVEGGGAFAVKRAQPFEGLSRLLQWDDRADLLDDIEPLLDPLDDTGLGHRYVLQVGVVYSGEPLSIKRMSSPKVASKMSSWRLPSSSDLLTLSKPAH